MLNKSKILVLLFIFLPVFFQTKVEGYYGSCKNIITTGELTNMTSDVRVNRQGAATYKTKDSIEEISHLNFNEKYKAKEASNDRFKIYKTENSQGEISVGWINKIDLQCGSEPLISEKNHLPMQIYIKTSPRLLTALADQYSYVMAYDTPDNNSCVNNNCRSLGKMTNYFVFDQNDKRYLIGNKYKLDKRASLIGWVNKNESIQWNTTLGIRPKETLDNKKIYVPLFLTIEDANNDKLRAVIEGKGYEWFSFDQRIPILNYNKEKKLYHVAVPLYGIGLDKKKIKELNKKKIIKVKPGYGGSNHIENNLLKGFFSGINKVDVFFLIDGTLSISPYLGEIKKAVKEIKKQFAHNEAMKDIIFRFAFGVYQDAYAKEDEFKYWYSFSESDCDIDENDVIENHKRFEAKIDQTIRALSIRKLSKYEDQDFEENLFGGLNKYIKLERKNCQENMKILFVIGDHGYSKENQKKYYHREDIPLESLIHGLRSDKYQGLKPVIVFFIQTPSIPKELGNLTIDDYMKAYIKFNNQALEILNKLSEYSSHSKKRNEVENFLLKLNDDQKNKLSEQVIKQTLSFIHPEVIEEVILDMDGGKSLYNTVERLMSYKKYRNFPALFWDNIVDGTCKHLGLRCKEDNVDIIIEGYLKESTDDLSIDIWIKKDDLKKYINMLSRIYEMASRGEREKARGALIYGIQTTMEKMLNIERVKTNLKLEEFIKKFGYLPVNQKTPLLSFSLKDLKDDRKIPDDEIILLKRWIIKSKELLDCVYKNRLPKIIKQSNKKLKCGIEVPYIETITCNDFPKSTVNKYKYCHIIDGTSICWVPEEYLP